MSPWFVVVVKWFEKWFLKTGNGAMIYGIVAGLLALVILGLNFVGIIGSMVVPLPGISFVAAGMVLFLSPLILLMVAIGFGAPDLLQNLFPGKWIEEIGTKNAVLTAGVLIAADIGLLLVPYMVNPASNWWLYGLAIMLGSIALLTAGKARWAIIVIGLIMLGGLKNWRGNYYGNEFLGKVVEYKEVGILDYPSRAGKKTVLDTAQSYGDEHAAVDRSTIPAHSNTSPLSYSQARAAVTTVGDHAHEAELVKAEGFARADGLTLSEKPDAYVQASKFEWKTIECLDVSSDKEVPCEFFPGNVIEARGTVTSNAVKDSRTGLKVPIGPCGIPDPDTTDKTTPYVSNLPRFAAIGRLRYPNGGYSEPFRICDSYTLQGHGFVEAIVNGDYRDKWNRTHDEWFSTENRGEFKFRLKR